MTTTPDEVSTVFDFVGKALPGQEAHASQSCQYAEDEDAHRGGRKASVGPVIQQPTDHTQAHAQHIVGRHHSERVSAFESDVQEVNVQTRRRQ